MSNNNSRQEVLATFSSDMKRDWDERARENAKWVINTLSLDQTDEEFYLTGKRDFDGLILQELALLTDRRDSGSLRLLEIGCGIGRMTQHMAEIFGEVHGIDVSAEMIQLAKESFHKKANVHFHETNGFDFTIFPDNYFDLIFSAYVFQHIPNSEIIEANIRDAMRVLKPGSIFKFMTCGITHTDYSQLKKDTWTGAAFPESKIRQLALEIDAQLLGVTGDGTQYCWSLMRKRIERESADINLNNSLCIISCGRADDLRDPDLPPRNGDIYLGLIIGGLNRETVDINSLCVELRGRSLFPCYVGPSGISSEVTIKNTQTDNPNDIVQVNLRIPIDEPGGNADVRVKLSTGITSNYTTIILPPPQVDIPKITLITNALDTGLDIYASGPKSLIKVFVEGVSDKKMYEDVAVKINEHSIEPEKITFIPNNAAWEIIFQLPVESMPGDNSLQIVVGGIPSRAIVINLK